jgi:hypothetical protein
MPKGNPAFAKMKQDVLAKIPAKDRDGYIAIISNGRAYAYPKEEYLTRRRASQRKFRAVYAKRRKEKRARQLLADPVRRAELMAEIKRDQKAAKN